MKKVLLAATLIFVTLHAEDIVHYDKPDTKKPQITKPNHPHSDLYTK